MGPKTIDLIANFSVKHVNYFVYDIDTNETGQYFLKIGMSLE